MWYPCFSRRILRPMCVCIDFFLNSLLCWCLLDGKNWLKQGFLCLGICSMYQNWVKQTYVCTCFLLLKATSRLFTSHVNHKWGKTAKACDEGCDWKWKSEKCEHWANTIFFFVWTTAVIRIYVFLFNTCFVTWSFEHWTGVLYWLLWRECLSTTS